MSTEVETSTVAELTAQLDKQESEQESSNQILRDRIAAKSAEGIIDAIDDVVLRAGNISITEEVKQKTEKLVVAVFGSGYSVKKNKPKKAAKKFAEFQWSALVETLKENKITSKAKAVGKAKLAELHFGNDKTDFKPVDWNDTEVRESHLENEGDKRGAIYWAI